MSARRLAIALHAVSTSPAMPRWPEYVQRVEAQRRAATRTNPRGDALIDALRAAAAEHATGAGGDLEATDLLTALASFTDDYAAAPPTSVFAVDAALTWLDRLDGAVVTAPEQLSSMLAVTNGALLDAALALHTATRVLARGRDTRLHPRFSMTLEERVARGRAIAPFHPDDARGGDPLGDTYHFWANVSAGLYRASGRRTQPRRLLVHALLWSGPVLMSGIRGGVFRRRLFYGNHARVDRLGLAAGLRLWPRRAPARQPAIIRGCDG